MKEQKEEQKRNFLHLIFWIFVFAGIIIIPYTLISLTEEQHVEIYKNECENITHVIGKKFINSTMSPCGYTYFLEGCMECQKYCISKEKFEANCQGSIECHYTKYGTMTEVYKKEIYGTYKENWEDITETNEYCGLIPVDKIIVNASICFVEKDGTIINECREDFSHPMIFTKEDITKEWLTQICKCIGDGESCYFNMPKEVCGNCICETDKIKAENDYNCPQDCSLFGLNSKCSRYKCFSDYEVETNGRS